MRIVTLASLALVLTACQGSVLEPRRPGSSGPGGGSIDPNHPIAPDPQPPSVAAAPMARLTALEIRNTIRDLYGDEAAALVPAGSGYGGASLEDYAAIDAVAAFQTAESVAALVSSRPELVTCDPTDRDACTEEIVRAQALRIVRRPMTDAEADRYVAAAASQASFDDGLYVAIGALLASPDFLYRLERGDASGDGGGVRPLTSYEMASRLSYAIYRSLPDDELFAAAAADRLRTEGDVRDQVRRMLADPRAREVVVGFHTWWLHLDEGRSAFREPERYPEFTGDDPDRWIAETERFVEHAVFDGEGTLGELLTASYSFPDGDARMDLPPSERAGLLTQTSILGGHVPNDRVAAIYRGAFVYRRMLCAPLGDPPMNIPPLPEADPHASLREQIEVATSEEPCVSCHGDFNPYGFALGRYDAVGRTIDADDNGAPIDTEVRLTAPAELAGVTVNGAVELANELASSAALRDCYVDNWFRYLHGRDVDPGAGDAYTRLLAQYDFEVADRSVEELLVALLSSHAFRYLHTPDA
ncbi:MAG: DUF1592 domain-containing protein [Sandaracinaceae bacterium]